MDSHGTVFVLAGRSALEAISVFAIAVFLFDAASERFAGESGFWNTKQGSNLYSVPSTKT
jgi:hypothetical protein